MVKPCTKRLELWLGTAKVAGSMGRSESEQQAIREHLEKLLTSPAFAQSHRLQRFLAYVVDASLAGEADRLNQYAIAVDVFDRDASFDPTVDAIVRVEAGRLRSKLLEYYDDVHTGESLRIVIPRRSYKAEFQFRNSAAPEPPSTGEVESAETASPPANPTLAVLPFVNMSADPEQDYFADGISEDLITDLSQVPNVSVIARQSSFAYKGQALDMRQVSKELGADLLLEGSVRKVGAQIRINAQLIEGSGGRHVWAERFDGGMQDIFQLQDTVNGKIVEALRVQLSGAEVKALVRRGTSIVDAHDYLLRGLAEAQQYTREGSTRARYCYERAIELDPNYAAAFARLCQNYIYCWIANWDTDAHATLDVGLELARRAVALDQELALVQATLCWAEAWQGNFDSAITAGRRALELDSNDVVARERLALTLAWAGEPKESLAVLDRAQALNPLEPYSFELGCAYYMDEQFERAAGYLRDSAARQPNFIPAYLFLAASEWRLGNQQAAGEAARAVRRVNPQYGLGERFHATFRHRKDRDVMREALRGAGLT